MHLSANLVFFVQNNKCVMKLQCDVSICWNWQLARGRKQWRNKGEANYSAVGQWLLTGWKNDDSFWFNCPHNSFGLPSALLYFVWDECLPKQRLLCRHLFWKIFQSYPSDYWLNSLCLLIKTFKTAHRHDFSSSSLTIVNTACSSSLTYVNTPLDLQRYNYLHQ